MLSKYILPGDKVELLPMGHGQHDESKGEEKKIYNSKVCDIVSEDRLEIVMPMEKTKLVLIPVNTELEICFFAKAGVFQCTARVVERYKSEGIYILLFELTSNLRKNQRREFYRFNCIINMCSRELQEEELENVNQKACELEPGHQLHQGVIVDISGGGLRFVSGHQYEENTLIYLTFNLYVGGVEKVYEFLAEVLRTKQLENRNGQYEHRIHFVNIENKEREEIIRFIFEEERKSRQKR